MHLRRYPLFAASAGALLLGAPAGSSGPAQLCTIVLDKMKFGPVPAKLHQGDAIIWVNRDILRHSATATDHHSFDVDLPPGAKKKMVLTKTGTFPFICRYHPGMRGTLTVEK